MRIQTVCDALIGRMAEAVVSGDADRAAGSENARDMGRFLNLVFDMQEAMGECCDAEEAFVILAASMATAGRNHTIPPTRRAKGPPMPMPAKLRRAVGKVVSAIRRSDGPAAEEAAWDVAEEFYGWAFDTQEATMCDSETATTLQIMVQAMAETQALRRRAKRAKKQTA